MRGGGPPLSTLSPGPLRFMGWSGVQGLALIREREARSAGGPARAGGGLSAKVSESRRAPPARGASPAAADSRFGS